MTGAPKLIGIVLVLYRQKHNLDDLYLSLSRQTLTDFRLYFVENNTDLSDESYSKEINDKFKLDITYIRPAENLGFAGGNNLGAAKATQEGCSYLFFLNNDTFLDENCIEELKTAVDSDKNYGASGPLILFGLPQNNEVHIIQEFGADVDFKNYRIRKKFENRKLTGVLGTLPDTLKADLLSGGAVFFKTSAFNKSGFWEEKYFAYGDEIDLFKRLNDSGLTSVAAKKAVLWHNHNWSGDNKQGYYFEYYLIQRNKYLYFRKFRFYGAMLTELFIDMIKFPWRLKWFIKVCGFGLGLYYLRGTAAGLLGNQGKPNLSFVK